MVMPRHLKEDQNDIDLVIVAGFHFCNKRHRLIECDYLCNIYQLFCNGSFISLKPFKFDKSFTIPFKRDHLLFF